MLYERLDVWRRSRALAIDVYCTLRTCKDYGFKDQICRSALSVPSNIAEGCERLSEVERRRFFDIAKGSMGEFRTQADIGVEVGFVPEEIGKYWMCESAEIGKMLGALIHRTSN